jgi:hypothetical protein
MKELKRVAVTTQKGWSRLSSLDRGRDGSMDRMVMSPGQVIKGKVSEAKSPRAGDSRATAPVPTDSTEINDLDESFCLVPP